MVLGQGENIPNKISAFVMFDKLTLVLVKDIIQKNAF